MSRSLVAVVASILVLSLVAPALAEEAKSIQLPAPQTDGGRPLMQVLKDRATVRAYASDPLPPQELSNLLWAAFDINRPDSGKRTAPTAMDRREIDIYVALPGGLYLWDPKTNALGLVLAKDIREATGMQEFVKDAPVNLVYVADMAKMGERGKEHHELYTWADTGFISENVYLYCASAGLATVVRGALDREALAATMGLRPDQKVVFAQTVGYPKK